MQPTDGVQLFMEIINIDVLSGSYLIDRLALNLSTTPSGRRDIYSGIFDFAEIDISFSVICMTKSFYGAKISRPDSHNPCTEVTNPSNKMTPIVIQLVMGFSLLLVFIVTSIIILIYIKRKFKQYTQFTYIKYLRRNTGTEGNLYRVQDETRSNNQLLNDSTQNSPPDPPPISHDYDNDVDSSDIPYVPVATLESGKLTKNISYNAMKESFGCEPCPAYGSNCCYEAIMPLQD